MDFDRNGAGEYAAIRDFLESRGIVPGNMDILTAAVARNFNGTVVTNNGRHYQNIPDLAVENWAQ